MSVSDGNKVNAAVTNAAFVSRTTDSNTTGIVDVENTATASGSSVFNIQKEMNGSSSFTGRTLNGAKDEIPAWNSNAIGLSTDNTKVRVDNVQTQVETNTTAIANKVDKVTSTDNAVTRYDGVTGDVQDSGVIIDDSNNITGVNDLTVTGDLTVNGTTTTINTTTLDVEDANIIVNNTGDQATANTNVAGFTVEMSDATDARIGYDSSLASKFKAGEVGSELEIITSSATQIITNKDIDLTGTASASKRVVVSSDTTANLTSLARKKGVLYFDDTTLNYVGDDGTSLIELGGGGSGGGGFKNYFDEYGTFEKATDVTDNVISYDDGGAFVDGTGGAASAISFSFTSTTSEVLEKLGSLKISKAASDGSGEGVSFVDRAIDRADEGKVLNGSIEIDFTHANYPSGDISLKAYDITNAVELAILNDDNGAINQTKGKYQFRLQTLAGTETIRLAFHLETDSVTGSAYDLFVDDVKLGPDEAVTTGIVTPWQPYTTTLTGFGTVSVQNFQYRRLGDSVEIKGQFTSGTPTGVEARLSLPNNIISHADSNTLEQAGVYIRGVSAGGASGGPTLIEPSVSYITFGDQQTFDSAAVDPMVKQLGNQIVVLNNTINIPPTTIKIADWSSGAQISTTENALKNTVVEGAGNGGTVITASVTNIDFTEVSDNTGSWNGTIFTSPIKQDVQVSGSTLWTVGAARSMDIYVNTVLVKRMGANSAETTQEFNGIVSLNRGDQMSIRASAGGTLVNTATSHWISIRSIRDTSVFSITGEQGSVKLYDSKTSGTNGGGFTSGSFVTRTLNTIESQGASFATLSANQFTLQAGIYRFNFTAPAFGVTRHKAKLRNITDSTDAIIGSNSYSSTTNGDMTNSNIIGTLVLNGAKTFEIQHRCETTNGSNGRGVESTFGVEEIYTQGEIVKVK